MSEYLQKIIYLTKAQYETLQGGGTVGSQTGINNNYLYFTTDDNTTNYVPYRGNITSIGSSSPASGAKTWWKDVNNVPRLSIVAAYNNSGSEYSMIYSKGNADARYGTILRWGYADTYMRILRQNNADGDTWYSEDWEKISAGKADTLTTGRTLKVALGSTSASTAFNGSANITDIGVGGTLGVGNGGTGATSFTANSVVISGNTTTAALTTRAIKNMTSAGNLGWTAVGTDNTIVTTNTLAYWNGRYNSTTSNLAYCNKGAFGTIVTNNFPTANTTTTYLRGDGSWVSLSDMGLSTAMHFRGSVSADPTSTTPEGTYIAGDVVIYSNSEYVYDGTDWKELGSESSFKLLQDSVSDPTVPTSGTTTANAFIDTITQNTNGIISVTKKNLPTASTNAAGIIQIGTGSSNAMAGNTIVNKVRTTATTDNINYKLLMSAAGASPTSGSDYEVVYDADITINPSTHNISAGSYNDSIKMTTVLAWNNTGPYTGGWKRVCALSGYNGYGIGTVYINGNWSSQEPTLAAFEISFSNSNHAHIKQTLGARTTTPDQVRLVYSGTGGKWYFDIHIPDRTASDAPGSRRVTFIGKLTVTEQNTTNDLLTADPTTLTVTRTIVITKDQPTITVDLSSTTIGTFTGEDLTTGISGTLAMANGGTGATSFTQDCIIVSNGATTPSLVSRGLKVTGATDADVIVTVNGTNKALTISPNGNGAMTLSTINGNLEAKSTGSGTVKLTGTSGAMTISTTSGAITMQTNGASGGNLTIKTANAGAISIQSVKSSISLDAATTMSLSSTTSTSIAATTTMSITSTTSTSISAATTMSISGTQGTSINSGSNYTIAFKINNVEKGQFNKNGMFQLNDTGTQNTHKLYVNGDSAFNGKIAIGEQSSNTIVENVYMQWNSTDSSLDFIFA